jgi:DNA polymerase elongation subunit (family B)
MMLDKKVPPLKSIDKNISADIVGGYVKDPKPGIYNWVVTLDLNSLYPHLMLQYNMSPETYSPRNNYRIPDGHVDIQQIVLDGNFENKDGRLSICANGVAFTNTKQGVIPSIIDEYYAERSNIKKKMLSVENEIEILKAEIDRRKNIEQEDAATDMIRDGLERKRYKV